MSPKKTPSIKSLNRPRHREARTHHVGILLNDSELRALTRYCERYGIKNRSRFVREIVMRSVLKQFEKDAPTLFD
jgi:metal-responsive CopG/Arc/MetJ family transcriptional regulator